MNAHPVPLARRGKPGFQKWFPLSLCSIMYKRTLSWRGWPQFVADCPIYPTVFSDVRTKDRAWDAHWRPANTPIGVVTGGGSPLSQKTVTVGFFGHAGIRRFDGGVVREMYLPAGR